MVGRHRDFEIALQKLRGPDANIAREADEIKVHSVLNRSLDIFFFCLGEVLTLYKCFFFYSGLQEYLATIAHLPKATLRDLVDKKNIRFVIVRISNSTKP